MPQCSVPVLRFGLACSVYLLMAGCSFTQFLQEPDRNTQKETVQALTEDGRLLTVRAAMPWQTVTVTRPTGLPTGETVVAMDYRVANGVLYALGRTGQLYLLDADAQAWKAVGAGRHQTPLVGSRFEMDFNPTVMRIRVVSDKGQNFRIHPDTGLMVDGDDQTPGVQGDPLLSYAAGDTGEGRTPVVTATAYTYNQKDDKITTNYVIDIERGVLAMQGSKEGVVPVESPNLGILHTVGSLGLEGITRAALDISDVNNTALLSASTQADARTRLYRVDLESGQAKLLGTLGNGERIVGFAIQP